MPQMRRGLAAQIDGGLPPNVSPRLCLIAHAVRSLLLHCLLNQTETQAGKEQPVLSSSIYIYRAWTAESTQYPVVQQPELMTGS